MTWGRRAASERFLFAHELDGRSLKEMAMGGEDSRRRWPEVRSIVRIDKWLWAARFFKTRSLAARVCDLGRIEANGVTAKPAREIRVGDRIEVRNESGEYQVEVLALSEMRGPAAVAQTLYRETEESREARRKAAEQRKVMPHFEDTREGKPSKRDRRRLDRLRGR